MSYSSFENPNRKKKPVRRQAVPLEEIEINASRRRFIKSAGLTVAGVAVGGIGAGKLFKKLFKSPPNSKEVSQEEVVKTLSPENEHVPDEILKTPGEKHITKQESKHPQHATYDKSLKPLPEESTKTTKENNPLDAYSFLDGQSHPKSIPTGRLAENTFSDLYATYLGIPTGTALPETLNVDFKENLASLWREKFDLPKRSDDEHDSRKQLQFLGEHHNLMNLAEYLYRSYDVDQSNTMTLNAYRDSVVDSVKKSSAVFTGVLEHEHITASKHEIFSKEKLSLIGDMGRSLTADTFLALSFTELMPSNNGGINAQVFDFLLRNAGVNFIERIPSVHDMLESFGQYQITPDAISPDSAGSWAAQIFSMLPSGFMPGNVDGLLRGKENTTAYTLAMLHITQFVGTRNSTQLKCLSDVLRVLSPEQRARAILSFVAASHHVPKDSYDAFDSFIWSMYVNHADSFNDEDILKHIPGGELRTYTGKALENHKFLIEDSTV